jgi:hypothetical protein
MQALIKFGDNDIPGALSGAYKAYTKFKTSENLDRLRKQNLMAKASLGGGYTDAEAAFMGSPTSYRRLDSSFLSSGENAKLAEEFEKKTGIKRQDFLHMLTSAAENKLYVSDPKLAEKVDSEFEAFVEKIPNPEFRAKVKNGMSLVPSLQRHQLLVKGVQKMVALAKDFQSFAPAPSDITKASAPVLASENQASKPVVPEAVGEALAPVKPEEHEAKAEEVPGVGSLNSDEMARAQDRNIASGGDLKLDGVVLDAVKFDADKETIFQIVSRRYKLVTNRVQRPKGE